MAQHANKGGKARLRARDAETVRILISAPEHFRGDLLSVLPGRSTKRQRRIAAAAGIALQSPLADVGADAKTAPNRVVGNTGPGKEARKGYVPLKLASPRHVVDQDVYPKPIAVDEHEVAVELSPGVVFVGSTIGFMSVHQALTDQMPFDEGEPYGAYPLQDTETGRYPGYL